MNQHIKTSLGVIIILIVAITAGMFVWLSQKNNPIETQTQMVKVNSDKNQKIKAIDETANWKTYQNNQYGYELKYPADWKITTMGNVDPATFSAPDFESPDCSNSEAKICDRLSVGNIHKAENNETIESDISLNTNDKVITKKTIKISGEDASFVEYYQANYGRKDGKSGLVRQEIKTMHQGTVYRIYVDEYNADINKIKTSADWENKAVFEAIITSFKFLDANDNQTADRKTYRNEKYGFSIQLPIEWKSYSEYDGKILANSPDKFDSNPTILTGTPPKLDFQISLIENQDVNSYVVSFLNNSNKTGELKIKSGETGYKFEGEKDSSFIIQVNRNLLKIYSSDKKYSLNDKIFSSIEINKK